MVYKKIKQIYSSFKSSIFAEYVPMFFVLLLVVFGIFFYQSNGDKKVDVSKIMEAIKAVEAETLPRITGNETDEEIGNNPYIKHIRTALNGFLDGSNTGVEEVIALGEYDECGLRSKDKEYYQSKFFLYEASDNPYGGVQAYIVFIDKPDILFGAWVYQLGGDGEYSLRSFCKAGPPEEKRDEFIKVMTNMVNQGEVKTLF